MRYVQVLTVVVVALLVSCGENAKDVLAPPGLSGPMASIGIDPVTGATIETNQDDYLPGQIVHVTGYGWAANETVHLGMTENPDTHGDVAQDVQADSAGAFSLPFYDVQEHDLGVTFTLTATGQTSGSSATAVFTDSRAVNSYTLNGTALIFPPPPPSAPPATNPITASAGSSVSVAASVTTTGTAGGTGAGNSQWLSTSVEVKLTSGGSFTQIKCDETDANAGGAGTFSHTFTFVAPGAGTYDVRVRAWAANGCSGNNGDKTYNGAMIITAKADQTITFGVLANKTYGNPDFAVSATASSGLPVSFGAVGTCSISGADVHITGAGSCTITASQAGNASYNAAPDVDQSFTIGQAAVTATAGGGSGTYDGFTHTPSACVVTGAYTGDLSCVNSPAAVGPNAGTTTISPVVSGTGLSNFDISSQSGSFTIEQAPVTATAGSGSGTYNGATHTPAACAVTGVYTGDLSCTNSPATVGPDAGTTAISPLVSGTGLTNFDVTSESGSFTIEKAPVTATAGSGSGTYNGATHTPSACAVTGAYTGDLSCANDPAAVGPDAGTTTIGPVVGGSGLSNFDITAIDGSFTIAKANASITVYGYTGIFDGLSHGATGSATGVLDEDLSGLLNLGASYTYPTGGQANWSFAGNGNYNATSGSVTISIQAWTLNGFYQPVDMNGVYNVVKGGSTVPLKFEIFAGSVERTGVADVKPFVVNGVSCSPTTPIDEIELTTTGGTTLRYDAVAGQFIQNWQTPKLAGQCFKVTMTTQDNSTLTAFFKLK